jgi:hypothetical protein
MTNELHGICSVCGIHAKIVRVMQIVNFQLKGMSFSGQKSEMIAYCDTCFMRDKWKR